MRKIVTRPQLPFIYIWIFSPSKNYVAFFNLITRGLSGQILHFVNKKWDSIQYGKSLQMHIVTHFERCWWGEKILFSSPIIFTKKLKESTILLQRTPVQIAGCSNLVTYLTKIISQNLCMKQNYPNNRRCGWGRGGPSYL